VWVGGVYYVCRFSVSGNFKKVFLFSNSIERDRPIFINLKEIFLLRRRGFKLGFQTGLEKLIFI